MSSSASENGYTATEAEKSSSAASAGSSSEIVKASNETGQLKPSEEAMMDTTDPPGSGDREEREVRKLTLETLLREGVLESGDGVLSMEYMGMRFTGDLLSDGSIRWGESGEVFPSPSAWAIHCKRITQPDKKTSCGWSQVKYKGRKLELYKQEWLHRHQSGRRLNTSSSSPLATVTSPLNLNAAPSTSSPTTTTTTTSTSSVVPSMIPFGNITASVTTNESIRLNETSTCSTSIASTAIIPSTSSAAVTSVSSFVTSTPEMSSSSVVAELQQSANSEQTKPTEDEPKAFEEMIRVGKTVIRKPRWFIEAKRRSLGISGESDDDNKENGSRGQSGHDNDCNGAPLDKLPDNPQYDPVTFASIERLQPFHISVSSNVLLLVDFHCHLSKTEVCGYLGGTWDVATHAMQITQAFPVKVPLDSVDHVKVMEEIQLSMCSRSLCPVGWYHSHPRLSPHPTKRDVLKQLDYQLDMRGDNEAQYMPVIGLICSPQGAMDSLTEAELMLYWVMPPPENRPHEVGKAMKMVYAHNQDSFLTQDLLMEMRLLAEHYRNGNRLADFTAPTASSPTHTVWDQLKASLSTKLPRDLQTSNSTEQGVGAGGSQDTAAQAVQHFWEFVRGLIIPNGVLQQQQQLQQQIRQQQQQQQLIQQQQQQTVHSQPGTSKN